MQSSLAYFVFAFFAGPWEIIIVAMIILLLFGNRLPSLMRSMGRSVVEFKKGVNEIEDGSEVDPKKSSHPE